MTAEDVRLLCEFNAWANGRMLKACAALKDEEFLRDLGSSFRSVRDTLAHMYGAEWVWLERWNGRSPAALPAGTDFPDFATVRARLEGISSGITAFAAAQTPENLARVIEYRNFKGNMFAYPLAAMIQHVVNHGSYHRGQITTMLRQLGAKPFATDLLRYHDFLASHRED